MAFDRSKYTNRVIKQEVADKQTISNPDSRPDYAPVLYSNKLPEGNIIMNILPPHNTELNYYQQCSTSVMDVKKEDKDGNKTIGKKAIFSGEVHSETGRCVVKEYIKLAEKISKEEYSNDAAKLQDRMDTIYGKFVSKGSAQNKNGISPSTTYAMYVHMSGNSGLPEGDGVYKLMANYTIKNRLVEIQNANQEINQPMTVDIYTSPADGVTLNLTIDNKASGKDKYKVDARMKRVPVPDEAYEFWEKQTPLDELYIDSYTQKDFNLAIEGLENFDNEHGFGLFGTEDFLNICEELSALYPEPKTASEKEYAKNGVPDLPFGNPKEEDKTDLPWEGEEESQMVDNNSTTDSPSTRMDDAEKAAKLAALKAKLAKK